MIARLKASKKEEISEQLAGLMAMAANTSDIIDWRKLQTRLVDIPPGLTSAERVGLLLQVANDRRVTAGRVNQLAGVTLIRGNDTGRVRIPASERARLVANLSVLTDGTGAERAQFVREVARNVSRWCVAIPGFPAQGARADRLVSASLTVGFDYGLLLLTDRKLLSRLRRCPYSRCRKFFLARDTRGAPPKYCSKSHSRLGDSERAAARMAKLRKSPR